jgi:hypothetical protein
MADRLSTLIQARKDSEAKLKEDARLAAEEKTTREGTPALITFLEGVTSDAHLVELFASVPETAKGWVPIMTTARVVLPSVSSKTETETKCLVVLRGAAEEKPRISRSVQKNIERNQPIVCYAASSEQRVTMETAVEILITKVLTDAKLSVVHKPKMYDGKEFGKTFFVRDPTYVESSKGWFW